MELGSGGFELRRWVVAKLVSLVALLLLIGASVGKWWFWGRAQARGRRKECSITVAELYRRLGVEKRKAPDLRDAAALGDALRDAGLLLLAKDGLALARKRRRGWWNLKILPILLVVLLAFALFTKRFPTMWVVAVGMVVVALHVAVRISGIGVELRAVKRGWEELEKTGGFRQMSEEEAVLECARASVWNTVLPW